MERYFTNGFYADVLYDVQMLRILYTTVIIFMR